MTATVIYPGETQFNLTVPETETNILAWMWRNTNHVDGSEAFVPLKVRSSMVGDLFVVGGMHHLVEPMGFKELDSDTAAKWMMIGRRDRIFGYDWCQEKGLI
jgi:hypothetical protein